MLRLRNLILCTLLAALSAPAFADEAKQVFDSLYAQKIRQVTATTDRADDIALAKEMLAIARESGSTPKLQILLAEATADLAGKHPDGYATAIEALQLVADEHEGQREAARAKMIDLLTRQSRTGPADARAAAGDSLIDLLINMGDEKAEKKQYAEAAADYRRANTLAVQRKSDQVESIKAKLEFAMSRDRAVKQIARLQEKLLQNANDHATAEEIVKLYVVELDEPKAALPFLNRVDDEKLSATVRLAAKPMSDIRASELFALGEWYKSLGDAEARVTIKCELLTRAKSYLFAFRETQPSNELQDRSSRVMLDQINDVLTPLIVKPVQTRVDLLALVEPRLDQVSGEWQVKGKRLISPNGVPARLVTPATVSGSYQLTVRFTRIAGVDCIIAVIPVARSRVGVAIDTFATEGGFSGLEMINDKRARENDTCVKGLLIKTGQSHVLTVDVNVNGDNASIQASIDGKKVFGWKGEIGSLGVSSQSEMNSGNHIGFVTWHSSYIFHSAVVISQEGGAIRPVRR